MYYWTQYTLYIKYHWSMDSFFFNKYGPIHYVCIKGSMEIMIHIISIFKVYIILLFNDTSLMHFIMNIFQSL